MKRAAGYSLSIGKQGIVAVKVSPGDGPPYRVDWVAKAPAGGELSAAAGKELARCGDRMTLWIPSGSVSLRQSSFPPLKPRELQRAILGEIQREKGPDAGDWLVSHQAHPSRGRGEGAVVGQDTDVLCAERRAVADLLEEARRHQARPSRVLPGFLVLSNLFRLHRPDEVGAQDADHPWSFAYLGRDERFICLGRGERLMFVRPLPDDLSGGAQHEEYIERLAAEVERSVFFARQSASGVQVETVAVAGDPQLADHLIRALVGKGGVGAVRWQPENLFASPEQGPVWEMTIAVAAAATAARASAFNLLPPSDRSPRGKTVLRRAAASFAAAAAAAAPLLVIGGLWTLQVQRSVVDSCGGQLKQARARSESAITAYVHDRIIDSRQRSIQELVLAEPDLGAFLRDLGERTPRGVRFAKMGLSRDDNGRYRLVLEGESTGRSGVQAQQAFNRFLDALATFPQLQQAESPWQLEISGEEDGGAVQCRVRFALEYFVQTNGAGP